MAGTMLFSRSAVKRAQETTDPVNEGHAERQEGGGDKHSKIGGQSGILSKMSWRENGGSRQSGGGAGGGATCWRKRGGKLYFRAAKGCRANLSKCWSTGSASTPRSRLKSIRRSPVRAPDGVI